MNIPQSIASELQLPAASVTNAVNLLESGSTIPFVARYRKDQTGGLDEVQLLNVSKLLDRLHQLEDRRQKIMASLADRNLLGEELEERILGAADISTLEDIYLPYKAKRQSRADRARNSGLEPLARMIMAQNGADPQIIAKRFVREEVKSIEDALSGARDIIAEWMNESLKLRSQLRSLFNREAVIHSKVTDEKVDAAQPYRDYFNYSEPVQKMKPHRMLAIRRAEKAGVLRLSCVPDREAALAIIKRNFVKGNGTDSRQVILAASDAWSRLLRPALQNETLARLIEEAEAAAIDVFVGNLRQLLLAPPLGQKRVLAIDPGFKSGCKVVALDETGELLGHDTIFPHPPQKKTNAARNSLQTMVHSFKVEAIAIGNGTAGRETEELIRRTAFKRELEVYMVSEDGASVYSASPIGRKEFPQFDVTIRGAASIGRRLMDPLAELVKIDPQSLGVGQYQHDVNPQKLKTALEQCVQLVVNEVGVELNTASPYLLAHVSGLGQALAERIVAYRQDHGKFNSREELKNVAGVGPNVFELCAGFLRISDGENPLDNTAVHPESYHLIERMARKLKIQIRDLIENKEALGNLVLEDWIGGEIGKHTITAVLEELKKPSRDPRKTAYTVEFDRKITRPEHLSIGLEMWGVVTNITHFGAFVDIGVKQDGLVHISELADRFVSDPFEVVRINQPVKVKVLEVDPSRKRISLSMKQAKVLKPPV